MARSKANQRDADRKSAKRIVYDVPEAGALLGLSRGAAYEAARNGDIPTIRVGRLLKVPREPFHSKFGNETA